MSRVTQIPGTFADFELLSALFEQILALYRRVGGKMNESGGKNRKQLFQFSIIPGIDESIRSAIIELPRTMSQFCIDPERVTNTSELKILTEDQVKQWREQGYLLLYNVFDETAIQSALQEIKELQMKIEGDDFQVGHGMTFPTGMKYLDSLTLAPALIGAIKQILDASEIRVSQAETWKKTAYSETTGTDVDRTFSNQDQRIHMDYLNHTLLHPPTWDSPEAVACILYLSDSDECGGATRVVPRESPDDILYQWPYCKMPGFGDIPWLNDRITAEKYLADHHPQTAEFRKQVYARERTISFKPGTLLLYRHDLWHRGTPLKSSGVRFVQNLVFKKPNCDWLNNWNQGVAYSMYRRDQYVEKLIARLSIEQRNCLGIPLPGHPYWTDLTLKAVEMRYGMYEGFDITPYRAGV